VITRNELFDQVWGGLIVGDDSLNRAIAKVRRIGAEVAPGFFEIETIPRTGYRLTGAAVGMMAGTSDVGAAHGSPLLSRRLLIGGGAAAAALTAGGLSLLTRPRTDPRFGALMQQGEEAVDYGSPGTDSAKYFRAAAAIRPRDARAKGFLASALAQRAEFGEPQAGLGAAVREAEEAAQAALAVDPNEPHALMAMCILQRSTLDLATFEDRTRAILARDPANMIAMRNLWGMLQCAGRSHDALALIDRALTIKPLAAGNHYPKAQLLWILGRIAEADRVIDRAMQYWPDHWFVRGARFSIFAYTGRPRAARAMLDDDVTRPQALSPAAIALWRVSLAALDQRSPASIAAARKANLEAAERDLKLSPQALCVLSTLGEVDAAFEITDAYFAVQRPAKLRRQSAANGPVRSTAWRFAPWLFIPPTAALRADPRFKSLCDGIGLTDYWAKRGIGPDAFLFKT
jgi:tetratricopeptide (TPR) repeat protein